MVVNIDITNLQLFNESVTEVNILGLKAESAQIFNGSIQIHTTDNSCVPFYGFIEFDDFEERFGFVLQAKPE